VITHSPTDGVIHAPAHQAAQIIRMGIRVDRSDYVVALAGNPNTGKSTVFNALTGLRQHTGNWPGKTVTRAEGGFLYNGRSYKLVDLPGTYSLLATSADEEVARDFLLFGRPDVTVVVVDACRLERNLNLALQVFEITDRVVICLNLMDEARRQHIDVDIDQLADQLGVPVAPTAARYREGLATLLARVDDVATGRIVCNPKRVGGQTGSLKRLVDHLSGLVLEAFPGLPNARWVALRLLDGDERILQAIRTGELGDITSDKFVQEQTPPSVPGMGQMSLVGIDPPALSSHPVTESGKGALPTDSSLPVARVLAATEELRWQAGPEFHQALIEGIYTEAARIADGTVQRHPEPGDGDWDRRLDWLLTSRWTGFPIMIAMLAVVLWLTVAGTNVPSEFLFWLLIEVAHPWLKSGAAWLSLPWWLDGLLIDGIYRATAWVVAVMLPPMAIFFPLFTLLEDFGVLPRVAFNMDRLFRRCGAHGKQALTMCMGFGCNAAGVIATRVIDSPRERLLAIITNNFSLCNGRWPTQVLIATIFVGALVPGYLSGVVATAAVVSVALLGVVVTFAVSWALSKTLLQGEASSFHLELPPYRPPRILQTLYTSLIDRTIFVLWRAVVFAVPAGAVIWLIAHIPAGDRSLAQLLVEQLDPVGLWIGLNGVILLAYVVAIPANEIVIPTVLMLTVATTGVAGIGSGDGVMFEAESVGQTTDLLLAGGWTLLTGVNLMLFSLLHNPCSTTIYTIWKETRSVKWTFIASALPLLLGMVVCLLVAMLWRYLESVAPFWNPGA
jgi:ferrous iron transport protein B